MSRLKTKEHWTAALFLAALALGVCMFLFGLLPRYVGIGMRRPVRTPRTGDAVTVVSTGVRVAARAPEREPEPLLPRIKALIDAAEPEVNEALDSGNLFIQLYGAAQSAILRTVVEDSLEPQYTVAKLSDGSLAFVGSGTADTERHAQNLSRLQHVLTQRNIPLLYVQAPGKLSGGTKLPYGITDTGEQSADDLLWRLDELGVETLDLRENFRAAGGDWSSWFFRTDHHWTPEAAFFAYQILCDKIETYRAIQRTKNGTRAMHYNVPDRYRDEEQFTKTRYSDYFLGSQGKRVGSVYGGVDDITLWRPTFPTNFRYTVPLQGVTREGRFEETLLFKERVQEPDWFNGNPYTLYAGGDYPIAYATNRLNPSGPRIMLLRDSFACAITPFLALPCSELITVDLRYFNDDFMLYVDWLDPDLIFVLYTTGSTRIDRLFDFFTKPADRLPFPQIKSILPTEPPLPILKQPEESEAAPTFWGIPITKPGSWPAP